MAKVFMNSGGQIVTDNGNAIVAPLQRNEYGNDGTVDAAGLRELGWNDNDIAWLQKVCWWDAEDNDKWKVTDANKAFGPNGATPITWDNLSTFAGNLDIIFFPKLANTTTNYVNIALPNLLAIPTDGWSYFNTGGYNLWAFKYNPQLISVGDLNTLLIYSQHPQSRFAEVYNIRFKEWFKISLDPTQSAPTSIRYWFGGNTSFYKVDMSNIDFSVVVDNYLAFAQGNITELKIDKWNYAGTDFGMFNICSRLKEIYVNEITKSWTFAGCINLSRESCLRIFNALSESETGTITLEAQVKARLSAEDIAIATDKGWTIA